MKLVIGRSTRYKLGLVCMLVMSLGVLGGCAQSGLAKPSAELTPAPAAQTPATTTMATMPHQPTENWHCADKTWWRDYGARHGLDPSAYEQKCSRPMPASWAAPDSTSTNHGSSSNSSSSSSNGGSVDTSWKGRVSSSTLQTCIRIMQQPGPHANCSWHISSGNESLIVPGGPTNIQYFCYDTRSAGNSDPARRHYSC